VPLPRLRRKRPALGAPVRWRCGITAAAALACSSAAAADAPGASDTAGADTILVTARRRTEDAQTIPVAMTVVGGAVLDRTYTVSASQLTQLVPALNYSSPNPRNTSVTIRGLGSGVAGISQSNDGLEPGVGYYVDEVYHARPATAAFDFTDIEQIEVLRGPQGTLFGKNSTAGAINIRTKKPEFTFGADGSLSFGEHGFVRGSAAVTGPLAPDVLAFRISGLVNQRDGVVHNVRTDRQQNNLDNKVLRGQLLFRRGDDFHFRLIGDWSSFKGECCVPIYWKVVDTQKPAAREYPALAAGQHYAVPSTNIYDRQTDIDAKLGVDTSEGGVSGIGEWNAGPATLTSITAWRFWKWSVDNDRDYIGLPIQMIQRIPSRHDQYSQEFRLASPGGGRTDYVAGLYYLHQKISGDQTTVYGPMAAYWLLPPGRPAELLDGYGLKAHSVFRTTSYGVFAEATWRAVRRLAITGGVRYTYEEKDGTYAASTSGGLATTSPALVADKSSILRAQSYAARTADGSASARASLAYNPVDAVMVYAGFSRAQKSGGINMAGLPVDAAGNPVLATAVVRPEKHSVWEAGVKTKAWGGSLTIDIDAYHVSVTDFQTNVVDTVAPAALRSYLANIPKVRVQGVELDAAWRIGTRVSLHAAGAYTDSRYVAYANGPCPIERIGTGTSACDLTGRPLAATPKWSGSAGGEYAAPARIGHIEGRLFFRADASARSKIYGDGADSAFLALPGYALVNAALGWRTPSIEMALFARNLFNRNYLQSATAQAGNSGLVLGDPGEPRILGATLRVHL